MNAIILCGGLSTRLGDITKTIPKILLEIKGKSVLNYQLEKLKKVGAQKVVLAAGHLSSELRAQVGDKLNGVDLIYSIEEEKLGTGGAIKRAWSHFAQNDDPVMVLNGDVLTSVDLSEMKNRLRHDSDGIIFGAKVEDASNYGTLYFDQCSRLLEFKEKEGVAQPGYINGGIYLFNQIALKYFPFEKKFSVEYDVFPKIKNLDVFASDDPWIDIGVPERLAWARDNWLD
jgi:D-glycero-alpha-D-manno-heptose 1-phosphate guanylyltransferase